MWPSIKFLLRLGRLAELGQHLPARVMDAGALRRQRHCMVQHFERVAVTARLAIEFPQPDIGIHQRLIPLNCL